MVSILMMKIRKRNNNDYKERTEGGKYIYITRLITTGIAKLQANVQNGGGTRHSEEEDLG